MAERVGKEGGALYAEGKGFGQSRGLLCLANGRTLLHCDYIVTLTLLAMMIAFGCIIIFTLVSFYRVVMFSLTAKMNFILVSMVVL